MRVVSVRLIGALVFASSLMVVSSCEKKKLGEGETSSPFLTVEKKNMSFIQKYSGTWCAPCGGWGFTTFASLIDQFGTTDAFGAVVSGDMAGADNESIFDAHATMYGSAITGTPTFLCNMQVTQATSAMVEGHRSAPVVAGANYELSLEATKIKFKTTTQFFTASEGKDYYLFPYVIVDGIVADQAGNAAGAATVHKKTIVTVANLAGMLENSTQGYKIASGEIRENYKVNLDFETNRLASWPDAKISVVLVIATKNSSGKFVFVNAYTKH